MWLVCVELSLIVGLAVFPGVHKYEQAHHTINHLYQPALSVPVLISACAKTSGAQRQRRNAARRMTGWSEIIFTIGYECIYKIKQLFSVKRVTKWQHTPWDIPKNELQAIKPFILMILESIRSSTPVIRDRSSSSTRLKRSPNSEKELNSLLMLL